MKWTESFFFLNRGSKANQAELKVQEKSVLRGKLSGKNG